MTDTWPPKRPSRPGFWWRLPPWQGGQWHRVLVVNDEREGLVGLDSNGRRCCRVRGDRGRWSPDGHPLSHATTPVTTRAEEVSTDIHLVAPNPPVRRRIVIRLEFLGCSRTHLAHALGVGQPSIEKWVTSTRSERLPWDSWNRRHITITRLADALDVDGEALRTDGPVMPLAEPASYYAPVLQSRRELGDAAQKTYRMQLIERRRRESEGGGGGGGGGEGETG